MLYRGTEGKSVRDFVQTSIVIFNADSRLEPGFLKYGSGPGLLAGLFLLGPKKAKMGLAPRMRD